MPVSSSQVGKSGLEGRRALQKWHEDLNPACIVIPPGREGPQNCGTQQLKPPLIRAATPT